MGFFTKWKKLAVKENEYAEAHAEAAFDAHADPKIQLEQATQAAKVNHARLQQAASSVIANKQMAQSRLDRLQRQASDLEGQIKMELNQGDQDRARTVATQLASCRTQIETQTTALSVATTNADAAIQHVQESEEQLQGLLNRRQEDLAQIDAAREQEEFNAASATLSQDTAAGAIPTFDTVEDKIQHEAAQAQGMAQVEQFDPTHEQMAITHDAITAKANDILAEFQTPAAPITPTPAAKKTTP